MAESAIARWKAQAEAHHAQSERAQRAADWQAQRDFWQGLAQNFRPDHGHADDPALRRLLREVNPNRAVLDVGGGAGRYALPLARHSRKVTVVEPSPAMLSVLQEGAREHRIANVSAVASQWETAEVEPAEIALCAHVVYGVSDIAPFISKLTAYATHKVLLLAYLDWPQARSVPFWPLVHGEERIPLPALRELLPVLWELDIYPNLEMLPAQDFREEHTREAVEGWLRRFLYVAPGSPLDERFRATLDTLLVKTPVGWAVKGEKPRRLGLLTWGPGQLRG